MNNVISLDHLFHKRVFRVPNYQRGYSWGRQQVEEFLEDLELLGDDRYHYTGNVVLHRPNQTYHPNQMEDEDGNTYDSVEIVDGQQRLTTIVLLLDGIRRSLFEHSESAKKLSAGIKKNFVAAQNRNGQPLFKLSLNADTDHFFKLSVLADAPGVEGPQISSERRLANAKRQIADYLSKNITLHKGAGEDWLRSLHDKVARKLRFTLYQVEDEAEVGVIFEVMNDRGKPLTDLEKVKNFLLHASTCLPHDVPNTLGKSINDAWAEILRQLMAAGLESSADEDRLLRAHWLTHYNPSARRWKGSKSIKSEFDLRTNVKRPKEFLDHLHKYTERLRQSSVGFCDAFKPSRHDAFKSFEVNPEGRAQVIQWSAKLARVNVIAPFLPLLIAARERWPDEPSKYLEMLKLCEVFAFRIYRLRRLRSDAGQASLFRLGYDLARKRKDSDDVIRDLKGNLGYWCSDEHFNEMLSGDNGLTSEAYSWGGLRYFLHEYETYLALEQGASPIVTWDELRKRDLRNSIEHILPRSIDNQPYWQERFTPSEHEQYVHDLGNLTLTKHNSHYSNKPFPDKKGAVGAEVDHCYAKSPLFVERELTKWEDWDTSAIEERRARLLEWAKARWAVDLNGQQHGEHEPEWDEDDGADEA